MKRSRRVAVLLAINLGVGLLVAAPSLRNPWFWDDLHLIRSYSNDELAQVWHETWDPDRIENPGYRPLMTLSNHLRYQAFGESPRANRLMTVVVLGCAFTLFALAFAIWGVPLWVTEGAAILVLTAKNFTYTYAWVTEAYHALQMLLFGAALLSLSAAIVKERPRRLLALSAAFWVLTLLMKDQGIVLFPILAGAALFGFTPQSFTGTRENEVSYVALLTTLAESARRRWASADIRWYLAALLIVAVSDMLALRFFVPEAVPGVSYREFVTQIRHTVSLGGLRLWIYYGLASAVLVGIVVLTPSLARASAQPAVFRAWALAWFALFAMMSSALFALSRSRSDLVYFPVLFFALFVCAGIELLLKLVWSRATLRYAAGVTISVLLMLSLGASLSASWRIQQAMSRWSIQTLALNGSFVYGERAPRASISMLRRRALHDDLRTVGIEVPEAWDETERALCLKSQQATSQILVPAEFAWNDDWALDCTGQPP